MTDVTLVQRLTPGTRVLTAGTITVPPGWIHARVFYVGRDGAGIRVYVADRTWRSPASLTIGAQVRVVGVVAEYRGEKEIVVSRGRDIVVLACCQNVRPVLLTSADLRAWAGTLVRVEGRVDRVYRRTLRLRIKGGDVYVYAPASSHVDVRALRVGERWAATGVVTRGPRGWQIIVRGTGDLQRLPGRLALSRRLIHIVASTLGGKCFGWWSWPLRSGHCLL